MNRDEYLKKFDDIITIAKELMLEYYENIELEAYPEELIGLRAIVNMLDNPKMGNDRRYENIVANMLEVLLNADEYKYIVNTESDSKYHARNGFEVTDIDYDDNMIFIVLDTKL